MSDELDTDLLDTDESDVLLAQLKQKQNSQRLAMNKVRAIEKEYLDTVTSISSNLQVDARWLAICKTHIEEGTMAMIRGITRPNDSKGRIV